MIETRNKVDIIIGWEGNEFYKYVAFQANDSKQNIFNATFNKENAKKLIDELTKAYNEAFKA